MTFPLVLFLTLRFRRSPSPHALVSRVVVGVAVFATVAAYGVFALTRNSRNLGNQRRSGLVTRSVGTETLVEEPPTTVRRRRLPSEDSTQTDELSETDTTSEGYTLYSDSTSDADDPTVSGLD